MSSLNFHYAKMAELVDVVFKQIRPNGGITVWTNGSRQVIYPYLPQSSQYLVRIGAWTPKHLLRQTRPLEISKHTDPHKVLGGVWKTT